MVSLKESMPVFVRSIALLFYSNYLSYFYYRIVIIELLMARQFEGFWDGFKARFMNPAI